jgi:hypothetical protein
MPTIAWTPIKDGWESEAFNNAAMEQLHALEHLLSAARTRDR